MNDKKGNDDYQSSDIEGSSGNSLDYVLARLKNVEHDLGKHNRPWFRTSSNLISLLAVAVTVAIFVITYLSGMKETRFQKLQQFGQIMDQISALASKEVEIYRTDVPPSLRANAFTMISNRRVALINQAERLLNDINEDPVSNNEDLVSKLDLAILAPAYASIGRYKDAEKYLKKLAKANKEPLVVQVAGWRSLVWLYGYMGPEHIIDAKKAMSKGLALIGSQSNDIMLKRESVMLPYALAFNLIMARSYGEAFGYLLEAERNAWAMPCALNRRELLIMVQTEIEKILPLYPDGRTTLYKSRAEYDQPCPNDQAIVATTPTAQHDEAVLTSDYVGDYRSDFGIVLVRESAEGLLQVTVGDKPVLTLVSVGDDIFVVQANLGYYLAFQRDDAGEVTHILFLQPNGVFSAFRS